ncbi:hypothetical protein ACU4HD_46560 [Cupriavidus basilensis]
MIIFDDGANSDAAAQFNCNVLTVATYPNKSSGAEQCALYGAAQSIAQNPALLGNLNLGFMMFGPTARAVCSGFPTPPRRPTKSSC